MSIKALVESIETARVNNQNLGALLGGTLAKLSGDLIALAAEIEKTKQTFTAEIEERDRDLIRLMEGAA